MVVCYLDGTALANCDSVFNQGDTTVIEKADVQIYKGYA